MKSSHLVSRREDNKTRNRNSIIEAARKVFASIGFEACSTREIIRASGLAQGTFYNYYKDKESVMQDIADELSEGIRSGIREARAKATTPLAFLSDAYFAVFNVMMQDRTHLELIARNRDIIRGYLFQGGPMTYILEELDRDVENMISAGSFSAHPIHITSVMMVAAGFEAMVLLANENRYDIRKLSDFLGLLFQGGIERVSQMMKDDGELFV
ncbi:TetR/AcrR family transcriptional regulator [Leptospira langatensis]|uniref:TetR/AcrR family transcriptional regulator n=1 Tax=Leptospira langatensis TaxID=2484983 RepID=A0A5F1ZVZ5_9LEPT|nr:TetR/AcrR family transcriptional regulator [Leptospira langatensis]TGK00140.1 TetR/AcrR family transcriptional regulator [Leptospira langatensis]TGL42775.1 TetR/AcrR family transcriptional regulator [Leptospira langatensis]